MELLVESQVPWTEEQWGKVQETVREEAQRVRVAASFLPIFGPLPPETVSVPLQIVNRESTAETTSLANLAAYLEARAQNPSAVIDQGNANAAFGAFLDTLADQVGEVEFASRRSRGESRFRLAVDDRTCRPLSNISVNVYLRTAQVHDTDLSSALIMFRRAANIIARVEDAIIFNGQPRPNPDPLDIGVQPPIFTVSSGEQFRGLIEEATFGGNCISIGGNLLTVTDGAGQLIGGQLLVQFVVDAITKLEDKGHLGPFALVLGSDLFIVAHRPDPGSLVLPADRITPLLGGGRILRSSTIKPKEGVLVSLAGELVELVVASDISAKFIQVTVEPRYIFRVSQRFTLRVKERNSLMALVPNCPP